MELIIAYSVTLNSCCTSFFHFCEIIVEKLNRDIYNTIRGNIELKFVKYSLYLQF